MNRLDSLVMVCVLRQRRSLRFTVLDLVDIAKWRFILYVFIRDSRNMRVIVMYYIEIISY